MDLDELKNTWDDLSSQVNAQNKLNPEIIEHMIKTKYNSTIKKVIYPELTGIAICIIGAVYIGFNFSKLNTTYLQAIGIIAIILLLTLSIISIISISKFNILGDLSRPYAETLKKFAIQKIRFSRLQRINVTLSYMLLVMTIVLFSKLFGAKDITDNKYFWIFSFTVGYIFLLFYSKWVSKYYSNSLRKSEDLLKELSS